MTPITKSVGKVAVLSLLIYGSFTMMIVFGAGLPRDYLWFLETANAGIWKITGCFLLCVWIAERITNYIFCPYRSSTAIKRNAQFP